MKTIYPKCVYSNLQNDTYNRSTGPLGDITRISTLDMLELKLIGTENDYSCKRYYGPN